MAEPDRRDDLAEFIAEQVTDPEFVAAWQEIQDRAEGVVDVEG